MRSIVFLICFVSASFPAMAADILYFTSSPSSWVGHGQTRSMSSLDGFNIHGFRYFDQNAYTNAVSITIMSSTEWWDLAFVGPHMTFPGPGYYPNAARWAFQGDDQPGLDFGGDGRGNNQLSGEFTVYEAEFNPDGKITKFAADFIQYDEMKELDWVKGSIRLNSNLPIPVPEPSTIILSAAAVIVMSLCVAARKHPGDSRSMVRPQ